VGLETLFGLILATLADIITPVGYFVKNHMKGAAGYVFAVVFGILMYMCATMSVPLGDALIKQGMDKGAGLTFLIIGPITSYGTILVLKKEFGGKVLLFYLSVISVTGLLLGVVFSLI
jgi:uncharacterized membrane protein YraQ (UPF0718 family)